MQTLAASEVLASRCQCVGRGNALILRNSTRALIRGAGDRARWLQSGSGFILLVRLGRPQILMDKAVKTAREKGRDPELGDGE